LAVGSFVSVKWNLAAYLNIKIVVYFDYLIELARSRSFYERSLYIDVCSMVLELYSRTFFKEHFAEYLLGLYDDSVPNIRLRLCRLLPQVKKSLRLPSDKSLSGMLDTCVRKLKSNERDCDVNDALEKASLILNLQTYQTD
jgi:serine/threonine-protein phosphatase 4 regulatory subunit 4